MTIAPPSGPSPRLSVVMPVRNLAPFVGAAIESILAQSFADFEFVIRDDGSTDGTRDILRAYRARDPRIRLYEDDLSLGPAGSSNFVVREARAPIVARMDGDDISHPQRLARQLAALERHSGACLVGTLWEGIDEKGRRARPRDRWRLMRPSAFAPFPHGSIMFRREAFEKAGGYRTTSDFWEDLDLYRRMAGQGELLVLPEALYQHRASLLSTRIASPQDAVEASVERMYRHATGRPPGRGGERLMPYVFLSLGSTRLWAGRRPDVLGRILKRGRLRPDLPTARVLLWALWGQISPGTLRAALRTMVRLRDHVAGRRLPAATVYRWICTAAPASPRTDEISAPRLRPATVPPRD